MSSRTPCNSPVFIAALFDSPVTSTRLEHCEGPHEIYFVLSTVWGMTAIYTYRSISRVYQTKQSLTSKKDVQHTGHIRVFEVRVNASPLMRTNQYRQKINDNSYLRR